MRSVFVVALLLVAAGWALSRTAALEPSQAGSSVWVLAQVRAEPDRAPDGLYRLEGGAGPIWVYAPKTGRPRAGSWVLCHGTVQRDPRTGKIYLAEESRWATW